jgi:predicted hydrocarbon binding protein
VRGRISYGLLPLRALLRFATSMANVKGSKLSSKLAFVEQRFGHSAVEALLSGMPVADRDELKNVIDLRWYPFELYDRLLRAIVEITAMGDDGILDEVGAHSADHQLSNIYSAYKRDELLRMFKNMVPMHSHMNDPGRMEVLTSGTATFTIVVAEPKSTAAACRVSRAFYRRVAELAGARARVTEPACTARGDSACRFEIDVDHRNSERSGRSQP